jgi:hypothetical protein
MTLSESDVERCLDPREWKVIRCRGRSAQRARPEEHVEALSLEVHRQEAAFGSEVISALHES